MATRETVGFASVRRRGDAFVVTSSSLSKLWVMNGFVKILPIGVDTDVLGAAVEQALAMTELHVRRPDPDEDKRLDREILAAAGVRSWGSLERGTQLVNVAKFSDGRIEVKPTKRDGRGYSAYGDPVVLPVLTAATLGDAVLEALELCG